MQPYSRYRLIREIWLVVIVSAPILTHWGRWGVAAALIVVGVAASNMPGPCKSGGIAMWLNIYGGRTNEIHS
jgi:hypothetical protein